ncbi:hypothetical protein IFR35_03910 [Pseudomonas fluorescens]|uniref:hypothetical protein n=1 Tax=Pseudomonas fluorescens group TaxID=136843 RepID=UPI0017875FBD|nr:MULTISPECIES: hypothetical protein [Pseudomonas fluorescens group]MBD8190560.1 hypothetical protein [Pseudomonas fluorescens]MBD8225186.1 hypothetical protein [Pseudomonas fluorescens]MBD8783356.1 hypothetical protein [Pseudomonas fluorescens]MBD8815731.1 hypothetical protein [Pseudomonas fluorescens]
MKITWQRCMTYEEAKDYHRVIYLHEWSDKPFYWGKAHNSFFGGHPRQIGDLHASGRYNSGYRHWIEGCLRHGAKLYVGQMSDLALASIDDVENWLIHTYGHEMNIRVRSPTALLNIEHLGDVPASIAQTPYQLPLNPSTVG